RGGPPPTAKAVLSHTGLTLRGPQWAVGWPSRPARTPVQPPGTRLVYGALRGAQAEMVPDWKVLSNLGLSLTRMPAQPREARKSSPVDPLTRPTPGRLVTRGGGGSA